MGLISGSGFISPAYKQQNLFRSSLSNSRSSTGNGTKKTSPSGAARSKPASPGLIHQASLPYQEVNQDAFLGYKTSSSPLGVKAYQVKARIDTADDLDKALPLNQSLGEDQSKAHYVFIHSSQEDLKAFLSEQRVQDRIMEFFNHGYAGKGLFVINLDYLPENVRDISRAKTNSEEQKFSVYINPEETMGRVSSTGDVKYSVSKEKRDLIPSLPYWVQEAPKVLEKKPPTETGRTKILRILDSDWVTTENDFGLSILAPRNKPSEPIFGQAVRIRQNNLRTVDDIKAALPLDEKPQEGTVGLVYLSSAQVDPDSKDRRPATLPLADLLVNQEARNHLLDYFGKGYKARGLFFYRMNVNGRERDCYFLEPDGNLIRIEDRTNIYRVEANDQGQLVKVEDSDLDAMSKVLSVIEAVPSYPQAAQQIL